MQRFRDRLQSEFEMRRKNNPRHSLRAFAAFLGTDHSSLSQILNSRRPAPAGRMRAWAQKLGISPEEAAVYIAAEHVPGPATAERQNQLRHWTAEAAAIVSEPAHWQILRLLRTPEFRPDCRWIAEQAGVTVDAVNIAFTRLLGLRLVEAGPGGEWKDLIGIPHLTERQFRKLALSRIRHKAAEFHIELSNGRGSDTSKGAIKRE